MVMAIGASRAVSANNNTDSSSQISALEKQLVSAQKQLVELQKGKTTEATQKEQQLIAQRIAAIVEQIARLQTVAAQRSQMQSTQSAAQ